MHSSTATSTALICPRCQTSNILEARVCLQCGERLALVRAQLYLDHAESDITAARYDQARIQLREADAEMIGLSTVVRRQKLLTARAFWLQGLIYYHKGQTSESRAELLLAIENLEGIAGSEALMAKVLNQLGNDSFYERTTDAADYYRRSSEVAIIAGEHALAATALANLALIRTIEGHVEEAFTWYEQALVEAERGGDQQRLGDTYRLVASLYADAGPYSRALEYIEKGVAICSQIANPASVCRITNGAGEIYFRYRDLERSERWLRRSDEIAARIDYKPLYNSNAVALSNLMRVKGDHPAALNYANRACNQLNLANSERSEATTALVLYYIQVGDWPHTERYVQRMDEACTGDAAIRDQFNLASVRTLLYAAQGEWGKAEQSFQEAGVIMQTLNNKYEAANLEEEYAQHLLANPAVRRNSAAQIRATALLTRVAATWHEMEMPLRHARVAAML